MKTVLTSPGTPKAVWPNGGTLCSQQRQAQFLSCSFSSLVLLVVCFSINRPACLMNGRRTTPIPTTCGTFPPVLRTASDEGDRALADFTPRVAAQLSARAASCPGWIIVPSFGQDKRAA